MASVVIRAESAGGHYLYSEIVDATSLPNARAKARRRLTHLDTNQIVQKTRLDNYEYWIVVEERDVEAWQISHAAKSAGRL